MLHAVIMAGGSGTRFWPLSRTSLPKQLLNLAGERTMIQQAVDRCQGLVPQDSVWIVTNQLQAEATAEQLPEVEPSHVLREPAARNTAPCIGLAAIHLLAQDPDAIMLLMPADHVIQPVSGFHEAVRTAVSLVKSDPERLALFGIVPDFPSTGFGYIERGKRLSVEAKTSVFEVRSFREKPNFDTASEYLQQGTFFWNCGIFVWKAQTILDLIRQLQPAIADSLDEIRQSLGTPDYPEVLARCFPESPAISIDYAILEKYRKIAVVEALFQWDDVGSWQALHRLLGKDSDGNTVVGRHLGLDTRDCVIRSSGDHLITTLGVNNCIVVHTPDATFVADKRDENAVKQLIDQLKAQGLEEYL
ncbi:mannose-1-phosphate guanylyltransferase [Rubinisphaera margarita]|uniref:mannose-1-phosphate guanylyltransferase n=1 Tax=Rubinisphaera margarita TaxID=2909586 RepID=UPI001EE807F7|nr:mannose-1-phosphate guanylyltransferase [Rubinisphaera margarita]MCG6158612.1 mannose-1-phosphate guanylyltransferase [Rubinisphaera margarita]